MRRKAFFPSGSCEVRLDGSIKHEQDEIENPSSSHRCWCRASGDFILFKFSPLWLSLLAPSASVARAALTINRLPLPTVDQSVLAVEKGEIIILEVATDQR